MTNRYLKTQPRFGVLTTQSGMLKSTNQFHSLLINLRYEGKPRLGHNIRQTKQVLKFLKHNVLCEFQFEEKKLFPFLLRHIPNLETAVRFLERDHGEFRSELKNFEKSFQQFTKMGSSDGQTSNAMQEKGMYLICLLRHHMQAEDQLYKAMSKNLQADEKTKFKELLEKRESHGHEKGRN